MKPVFFAFSAILFTTACSTTEEVSKEEQNVAMEEPTQKPQRNAQVESFIGAFEESDPLDIDSMHVEGNKLFMYVSYSGGCREHQFKLVGSPLVMKTLPPKRPVQLVHDNEDDLCESIVSRVLEIDLKNLAYEPTPGSTIVLQLKGWKEDITYTYE